MTDSVPPPEPVIHASGLTKRFGSEYAVRDISFDIPQGAIVGFIGPSGCGKTTTMRMLTGVYRPTEGVAKVLGLEPVRFDRPTREKIGYMPQQFVLYQDLTVWENLNFAASIYGVGLRRSQRLHELLTFVELDEHRRKLVRQISGGMARRLSLAATLVQGPELLFLDEPTAGVDPVLRRRFWDYFRQLQEQGRTFLVTTQYVGEAAYCDIVGVMAEGRLLMMETPAGLRRRAYGGDVVELRATGALDYADLAAMRRLPFVTARVTHPDERTARLVVESASTAIPALIEWAGERGLDVESTEHYLPPFDDVFVELMRRWEDGQ